MQYKGYLRLLATEHEHHEDHEDHEGCERCTFSYVFETIDGSPIENLSNDTDAPINQLILVELENHCIVSWDYLEDGSPRGLIETTRKDIAFVKVVPEGKEITDGDWEQTEKNARELEDFFKQVNDGYWDFIRVTPYVINNISGGGQGPLYQWYRVRDQLEALWPGRYDEHTYWHGWGGFKSGILGEAYVNSSKAWTYTGPQRTMRHEQGHSFGCYHSTSGGSEYGDRTCIMAKAYTGFNASQMIALKQIKSDDMITMENNQTYFLLPVECSSIDKRLNEYKALQIGSYVLSTRKLKDQSDLGVMNASHHNFEGAIHVHKAQNHRFNHPSYEGIIQTGENRVINDTLTIKNAGVHEGVVRVEVGTVHDQPDYPSPLKMSSGDPITKDLSGVWYNPKYKHQGLDMFFIPEENRMVGYWFTYHPQGEHVINFPLKHNGKEWFVVDGTIDPETNVIDVKILQTRNRNPVEVGYGAIKFIDGKLLFRSYTENYGRDHWFLERLTGPRKEPSGIYESGDFEGYTTAKYGTQYVVYHYGYNGQNLQWYTYQGENPNSLSGYDTSGQYKQTYDATIEEISPVSIVDIKKLRKVY